MQPTLEISSYQADLSSVVVDVFRTMLSTEVRPTATGGRPAPNSLTAAIHFAGLWKGVVLLQCGLPEALAFTSCLIPGRPPEEINDDVRDALGELANMVGGNLKSVLPAGVALSMPTVVVGTDYALHICGGNAFKTVEFSSDPGLFWVTLVQVLDRARPSSI